MIAANRTSAMHVGLLSPAWPPAEFPNGIVTYVRALRDELVAQGHRVTIFPVVHEAPAEPGVVAVAPGPLRRTVAALQRRLSGRPATVFDFGRTIASALRSVHARDPIDVFEMEESFGWSADVASLTGLPVVVRLHGPAFVTLVDEELATDFGIEKVRREGLALREACFITAPSRCTLVETIDRYRLEPRIAEQVVNPLRIDGDLPQWSAATHDRNELLYVGRFDKIKGGDIVVRAFERLHAADPRLRLVFVGPDGGIPGRAGPIHLEEFIASLGKPALGEAIDRRGKLRPEEIVKLRTSAAVSVVASRRENQPYSALEAMLQACPLVCTDTSGLSEIVVDAATGLKARPEDPDDLARQIRRLLDDPKLASDLGVAGRRHVLEHHSPAEVVRQTVAVYRRAIDLHRRGRALGNAPRQGSG